MSSLSSTTTSKPSRNLAVASFLSGDETILIIPSFSSPSPFPLGTCSAGPFDAGVDTRVPLWVAVMLRKRNLCRIIPPDWLEVARLRRVLEYERDPAQSSFSPDLPPQYAEMSRTILTACGASTAASSDANESSCDIPNASEIQMVLEDVEMIRMDKIRRNVHTLSSQSLSRNESLPIIDVTGIGNMEMCTVKPFVLEAFRVHRDLTGKAGAVPQAAGASTMVEQAMSSSRKSATASTTNPSGVGTINEEKSTEETEENEEGDNVDDEASNDVPSTTRIRRFR